MMRKLKAKEREDYLAEISELRAMVSGLNQRLMHADMYQNSLKKDLEEQKEKYADLLRKHIQIMEMCMGMMPKFREEEDGE